MDEDPDMIAERLGESYELEEETGGEVALNVVNSSHRPNAATVRLASSVGLKKLKEFTARFYELAFEDPQIDAFIREHGDHHSERFALWIAEKFGLGKPWTEERKSRVSPAFESRGYVVDGAFDRSSAHFAAWHSPKRSKERWGDHFKLDDCRVWMRLHFKAARDVGIIDDEFGRYYVKFIAHFVSVYERTAPQFARESARWSEDPSNFQRYLDDGRTMRDLKGLTLPQALAQLPDHERGYTGSTAPLKLWPYA
ncbi:hypothetical protein CTAYLR_000141 [Chrysophaeum taylorii]|uniref:Uncharacterized protein n=1 Tax=Chrysophaeum taylorii TaxID=2483200 RepID=A0AAD7UGL2_9STRA|nr:hypothetical protein CTAYLR_000141 [Chrysophaeum taylorii]